MKAVDIQGNLNLKEQSCCKLNLKNRNERFAHFSSCCSCIRPLVKCTFDSKKSPLTQIICFSRLKLHYSKRKQIGFMCAKHKISKYYLHALVGSCKLQNSRQTIRVFPAFKRLAAQYNNAKELKKSQYFQPVPDFEMTITPELQIFCII